MSSWKFSLKSESGGEKKAKGNISNACVRYSVSKIAQLSQIVQCFQNHRASEVSRTPVNRVLRFQLGGVCRSGTLKFCQPYLEQSPRNRKIQRQTIKEDESGSNLRQLPYHLHVVYRQTKPICPLDRPESSEKPMGERGCGQAELSSGSLYSSSPQS